MTVITTDDRDPDKIAKKQSIKRRKQRSYLIFTPLLLVLVLMYTGFTTNIIPSGSMRPNLVPGDEIVTERAWMAYPFGQIPDRGDIITFYMTPLRQIKDAVGTGNTAAQLMARAGITSTDNELKPVLLIKRVIGLPGDTILIRNNVVIINGHPLKENYDVIPDSLPDYPYPYAVLKPYKVPPGHLFVLGDNRAKSDDSRFWGSLRIQDVVGKYLYILVHRKLPAVVDTVQNPASP